jgi:hypothetical protein
MYLPYMTLLAAASPMYLPYMTFLALNAVIFPGDGTQLDVTCGSPPASMIGADCSDA